MNRIIECLIQVLGVSRNTKEYKWSQSKHYQQRIEVVKDMWIGSGLIMLAVSQPAFILSMSLFVTFLSFAFLEK